MSEALVWHLIRDNNSFLVKRGRTSRAGEVQFSKEPGNLLSVNTFKYSGIANEKTVVIETSDYNKLKVTTKTGKNLNRPVKSTVVKELSRFKDGEEFVKGLSTYRADLIQAAKNKHSKLYKASRIKRKIIKAAKPETKRH